MIGVLPDLKVLFVAHWMTGGLLTREAEFRKHVYLFDACDRIRGSASSNGVLPPSIPSYEAHFVTLLTAAYTQAVAAGAMSGFRSNSLAHFSSSLNPVLPQKPTEAPNSLR